MYSILYFLIGYVPHEFVWVYPVLLVVFICIILGIIFKMLGACL